jgi:hypothetical protein
MSSMYHLKSIVCVMATLVSLSAIAADEEECTRAYAEALTKFRQSDVVLTSLRSIYNDVCSSQSSATDSSMNAGLKTMISNVPVVGSWASKKSVKSDASFCHAYKDDENLFYADNSKDSEPVIAAQKNYNECIDTFRHGRVVITHNASPESVVFSFRFTDDITPFSVEALNSKTFACVVPPNKAVLTQVSVVSKPHTIMCTRTGEKKGEDLYYPQDTIKFGTNHGTSYSVDVSSETIYGPTKQSSTNALIHSLEGQAKRADVLEAAIKEDRIELHPFHVYSGKSRNGGLTGDQWNWGDIVGKSQAEWETEAKKRYCPTAYRVKGIIAASPTGSCCGNLQLILACTFADPNVGK